MGNYSANSKMLLNRYNPGSGGISMTGPSTVPMMVIPTQHNLENSDVKPPHDA
jgi:hypothetical protein